MTYTAFAQLVESQPTGVVLLEGRRTIAPQDAHHATTIATQLATRFPHLIFRSGNAQGSDHAFSLGIAEIDSARLQIIAPYSTHRKNARYARAVYDSPESLTPEQEAEIAHQTVTASPQNRGLIKSRIHSGPIAAKAAYLIRDTMKVIGHSAAFPKPICALFYVDLNDIQAGGTGHTIRVCQQHGVPFAFQDSWIHWVAAR